MEEGKKKEQLIYNNIKKAIIAISALFVVFLFLFFPTITHAADPTSGTYLSQIRDTSTQSQFSTITWNDTLPVGTSITMEIRAGNNANLSDGVWTTTTKNQNLDTNFDGQRYYQYRITATTDNSDNVPSVEDVTISYVPSVSGSLISSAYNSSNNANILAGLSWDVTTSTGNDVQFQLQTSNDGTTWSGWMGPGGDGSSYFSDISNIVPEALADANNDQWVQYQAFLTSNGASTPILSSVTITYVVNSTPEVTNVLASENSDRSVSISYDVLDSDTSSGSNTPGFITPSFEYLDSAGNWQTAITFSTNSTSSKAVNEITTSSYNLIWYPQTDYNGHYVTSSQIRVTADDNEAANNLGIGLSPAFVLDTAAPVVSNFHVDGRSDTTDNITISASDDTSSGILIKISNLSNLNPDGTNASSGIWMAYNSNFSWSMNNSSPNIYYQLKDAYNNTTSITALQLPSIPVHTVYRDVSNTETSEWREFIAWGTVDDTTIGFKQYNIYRSDDGGTTFTSISTEVNRSINYYIDAGPLNSEITYFYKITAQDNNNNESNYSNRVSDAPNGQGGSDFTSPTISNVTISDITPNGATIKWDTDEPANSAVDYITAIGGDFTGAPGVSLATMTDNASGLGQHTIILTGLNAGTIYYFQLRSMDSVGNEGSSILDVDGYTFDTVSGPTISNILVTNIANTQATITWNTDEGADSHVFVADNPNFNNPVTYGNDTSVFSHSVIVDNLTLNTKYYYYITSGVASDKDVIDGQVTYYDFTTTADTSLPIITFTSETDISNLSDTGIRISWTTNKATTSTLDYGLDTSYGTTQSNNNYNINHSYELTSLTLGTTYYVRLQNTDLNNNTSSSTLLSFTTTDSSDTTSPNISSVTTSVVTDNIVIITWTTNEGSSSQVFYGVTSSTLDSTSTLDTSSNLNHSVILTELTSTTLYYYLVESSDANGNTATSTIKNFTTLEQLSTESEIIAREAIANQVGRSSASSGGGGGSIYVDRTTPKINGIYISDIGATQATMSWLSDENSDGVVIYGIDEKYNQSAIEIPRSTSKKNHQINILNLDPLTKYYYQITSADSNYNISEPSTGSFNTISTTEDLISKVTSSTNDLNNLAGPEAEKIFIVSLTNATDLIRAMSTRVGVGILDTALLAQNSLIEELSKLLPIPIISGQPIINVTANSATIAWNTDKGSNSLVSFANENTYTSLALYDQTIGEADKFVIKHIVEIKNLVPDNIYHYSVISRTPTGAETRSPDFSFKTDIESNDILNYKVNILSPSEVIFFWQTNIPTESNVAFTPYRKGSLAIDARQTVSDKSLTLNHSIKLNNLEAGVIYDIEISGKDTNDNIVSKTLKGFSSEKENLPPIIYQVQTDSAIIPGEKERIQVIISWFTNELATSRILYQKGFNKDNNNLLSNSSEIDGNYTKKHVVVINNFVPGTVYQFQVESIDSSGNSAVSKTINILTPQKEESVFQVIFGSIQDMFSWVGKVNK